MRWWSKRILTRSPDVGVIFLWCIPLCGCRCYCVVFGVYFEWNFVSVLAYVRHTGLFSFEDNATDEEQQSCAVPKKTAH